MTHENSHDPPISSNETYEYKIVCETCGVVGSVTLFREDARGDVPTEHDPARLHHERTSHKTKRVNYTTAPKDIVEMLDDGAPETIDFTRIKQFIKQHD